MKTKRKTVSIDNIKGVTKLNSMNEITGGDVKLPGWVGVVAAIWDFFSGVISESNNPNTEMVYSTVSYPSCDCEAQ